MTEFADELLYRFRGGFDAKQWDFKVNSSGSPAKLFTLTSFAAGKTFPASNGTVYAVPDGVDVSENKISNCPASPVLHGKHVMDSQEFSDVADASISTGTISAAVAISIATKSQ